ncbi:polysaccharide lyase family 8 super-sandwich domain-containing protein [Niabella hirudinis]|uniref:polysaccharide lyase family 8 super-sandwich domain-containing protein n=1 Tax=Niabella hirudinis TaxID=1285929 RepID=UPI003EBB1FF3
MRSVLWIIWTVLWPLTGLGQQQPYYGFDSGLPANFLSSGIALTLSGEHVKDGANSLKWAADAGAVLTAGDLGIPVTDIASRNSGSAQFFIYSSRITNDTLVFRFYDKAGIRKREGHLLLNFNGWRDYHRNYRLDYNKGKELPAFALDKMELIYRPQNPAATVVLYLDAFRFIGDTKDRYPGPQLAPDRQDFGTNYDRVGMLVDYLTKPDLPVMPATAQERKDAYKVNAFYLQPVPAVTPENLAAAKRFVTACHIRRNPDSSITGRGQLYLDNEDTLLQVSTYCGYLAGAVIHNADNDAKKKLLDFTEYMLDQGLAEGGRLFLNLGHYKQSLNFPLGFLTAMPLYPNEMKARVLKMLKWHIGYNRIYDSQKTDPNTDFMHLRSDFLFKLAALAPSQDEWVRDLKCISRYLGLFVNFTQGSENGLKADGTAFHHNVHYLGYMYAMGTYADRIYSLKGTVYRLNAAAYKRVALFYKASFLQSSKGAIYANSISGRNPFSGFPVGADKLRKLIEVGGDIMGKPYDPELAAFYSYIFDNREYPVNKAAADGYYQFNYGQLGVQRKDNWVAAMHGFTNRLWGAEIYATQNRYGRYQSYGSLEVLYNGDTAATGYPGGKGRGWDWNMPPGTTTVHLPFSELQAKLVRADEYNEKSFAGALALGKNGIFAIDFVEKAGNKYSPNHLQFHKSVFSFNDILVCLGSGIQSSNTDCITATNLFQAVSASVNPPVYINAGRAIRDGSYSNTMATANKESWLVNGQSTGFFVPRGGGTIVVERGKQDTPVETSLTGSPRATAYFSKAYISHGQAPANAQYRFVVVPGTTPQKMERLAARFASDKVYRILCQTDSLHAVEYLPDSITSYVFFEANDRVNTGLVKRISGQALVAIKKQGRIISITINNPDLNAVDDPITKWHSAPYHVSLQLAGKWKVVDNPSGAAITNDRAAVTVNFTLKDGLPASLKLLGD